MASLVTMSSKSLDLHFSSLGRIKRKWQRKTNHLYLSGDVVLIFVLIKLLEMYHIVGPAHLRAVATVFVVPVYMVVIG